MEEDYFTKPNRKEVLFEHMRSDSGKGAIFTVICDHPDYEGITFEVLPTRSFYGNAMLFEISNIFERDNDAELRQAAIDYLSMTKEKLANNNNMDHGYEMPREAIENRECLKGKHSQPEKEMEPQNSDIHNWVDGYRAAIKDFESQIRMCRGNSHEAIKALTDFIEWKAEKL